MRVISLTDERSFYQGLYDASNCSHLRSLPQHHPTVAPNALSVIPTTKSTSNQSRDDQSRESTQTFARKMGDTDGALCTSLR